MEVILVGFESLGVRSQATFIQARNMTIFIDPSAALAPRRYGLPPHVLEVKWLLKTFSKIEDLVRDSEYIIITHYHYDHHDPGRFVDPSVFKGKKFLIKDFNNYINFSQKMRAHRYLNTIKKFAESIIIADGKSLKVGSTIISLSLPLPHGRDSRLGYVISICVEDDTSLLFTSDIEGGSSEEHMRLNSFCKPEIAIIDGPPTYLLGYSFYEEDLKHSIKFLNAFIDRNETYLKVMILDHHIFRDLNYINFIKEIKLTQNVYIKTAAEFMGVEPRPLEAFRKALYKAEDESGLDMLKNVLRHSDEGELVD
jgi:predicted metallo-beta-lactamase superfamily hydrolase